MPSRYRFAEYSSEWPREIEREAKRWRELLGAELIEVHHIGSTSVPGLAAKPIIDVLPLVREIGRVDAIERGLGGRRLQGLGRVWHSGTKILHQGQRWRTHAQCAPVREGESGEGTAPGILCISQVPSRSM
jgi:GrpB-like predicted nucleotidyltransferase (UPF0157 family)